MDSMFAVASIMWFIMLSAVKFRFFFALAVWQRAGLQRFKLNFYAPFLGRPSLGRLAFSVPNLTTAGWQLFQCTTSSRGVPST